MNTKIARLSPCLTVAFALCGGFELTAQTTAFTYQGRLNDGGSSADGIYDLRFTLHDAASDGGVQGGPLTNAPTAVSNGLFMATLDFGAGPFTGAERWLEMGVRTNGSAGDYQPLTPRQQLTATPYAVRAANFSGALSDNQLSGNVALLPANQTFSGQNNFTARVGIGAASPATALHVRDSGDTEISLESTQGRRWTLQSSGTGAPGLEGSFQIIDRTMGVSRFVIGTNGALSVASFSGDGSRLTGLDAAQLTGTVADTQLSGNVVLLNATQNGFSGAITASSFSGSGTGLTGLNAAQLSGTLADERLSTNVALRTGGNIFSGSQQVSDTYIVGAEALDQQQTAVSSSTGGTDNWQSFTAGQSGLLTRIELRVSSPLSGGSSPGTIRIYAGEGTSGALLFSQSVTFAKVINTFQSFALSVPPQVQSGSQYTIRFSVPIQEVGWVDAKGGDPYPGGRANATPTTDYAFKTYVTPTTVGSILTVNPGYSGNVGIGTNLPQAKLHVVGSVLASGTFMGDGSGLTLSATQLSGTLPDARLSSNVPLLNATNRFAGVALLTNANNSIAGVFNGNAAALTNLNAAALSGTVADGRLSGNVALRAGGNFFSGPQRVSDTYVNGPETLDQQQTASNGSGAGLDNWQSFTPDQGGLLTRIALQVASPLLGGAPFPATIRIYAGEGTNGALLATESVTLAGAASTFQSFTFSAPPLVEPKNLYTIRFSVSFRDITWASIMSGNPYPGGRSDLSPTTDYVFKTYITPTTIGPILTVNSGFSGSVGTGNVGIGTDSPQAKLHVVGSVLASGTFMGDGSGLTNLDAAQISGNVALLNVNQTFTGQNTFSNSVSGGGITLDASGTAGAFNLKNVNGLRSSLGLATVAGNYSSDAAAGDTVLRASAGKLLLQAGSGASAIAIATNNLVGIGKTNPATILDVNGNATFTAIGIGITNPATKLHLYSTNDAEISVQSADPGGRRWTLQSSGTNGSGLEGTLQLIDRTVGASRLLIDTNGNVGIGTSGPTNKLHVNGGVSATAFVTTSDRNTKENFTPISPLAVLDKVSALPITTWNFKAMNDGRHMGPMAQDFYAAFGLGGGDTTITSVDPDGVALAAIQGLNQKVEEENAALRAETVELKTRLEKLERLVNDKSHGGAK